MVGVIILYDHVHPVGAFAKTSPIDVSLTMGWLKMTDMKLMGMKMQDMKLTDMKMQDMKLADMKMMDMKFEDKIYIVWK